MLVLAQMYAVEIKLLDSLYILRGQGGLSRRYGSFLAALFDLVGDDLISLGVRDDCHKLIFVNIGCKRDFLHICALGASIKGIGKEKLFAADKGDLAVFALFGGVEAELYTVICVFKIDRTVDICILRLTDLLYRIPILCKCLGLIGGYHSKVGLIVGVASGHKLNVF